MSDSIENKVLDSLLEVARRRLPPEDWCERVTELAAESGYALTWHFDVGEPSLLHRDGLAGTARAWAEVKTGRGTFVVAPGRGQTWQTAIEEALGIAFPNNVP